MKVAIVNKFFFLKGGQETVALEQMRLLEEAGHTVAFFSMHHPKNPTDYYWAKYFVDHADFSLQKPVSGLADKLGLAGRFIFNSQAAKRFEAFLDEFQPDIIHCHGIAHQLTYSILPIAHKRRIPIIQTLHDYQIICPNYTLLKGDNAICATGCSPGNYLPCIQGRCVKGSMAASALSALEMTWNRGVFDYARYVHKFISPSRFLADKVVESGINAQKMMHIPNFLVDIDDITPNYGSEGYFLYVGRLSYEKGLMTLLEAFRNLPETALLIAGDGPLKQQVVTYCQEHGLNNIRLLGHLNRQEMSAAQAGAKAILVPSEWYENQPMTIIEAFAHGKPVIATDIGGIPEMVIHDRNGYLFQPGDVQALSQHVQALATDETLATRLGQAARQDAVEQYRAKHHLDELTALYQSLAK